MSNTVVRTNVMALNSHRSLKSVGTSQSKSSQRLSSGYKVNSAADDAAGLAISEKMRAQIRGLDQASTNAQDAISLIQTAEGGMQEIDNMVQRIRELVVKAANDTNDQDDVTNVNGDRQKIQDEIDSLLTEIDDMTTRVEFNQKKLIDGTWSGNASKVTNGDIYAAASPTYNTSTTVGVIGIGSTGLAVGAGVTFAGAASANIAGQEWSDLVGKQTVDANGLHVFTETGLETYAREATGTATTIAASSEKTINGITFTSGASSVAVTGDNKLYTAAGVEVTGALTSTDTYYDKDGNSYNLSAADGTGTVTVKKVATEAMTTTFIVPDEGTTANATLKANAGAFVGNGGTLTITADGGFTGATVKADDGTTINFANASERAGKSFTANDGTKFTFSDDGTKVSAEFATASGTGESLHFQIGANANQSLSLNIGSVTTKTLGIDSLKSTGVMAKSGADLTAILDTMDDALSVVTTERSKLGAAQNRLEYTISSLDVSSENLSAAESRIRDADMAKEMMNLTQANVLQQAATSMLAQANQAPQGVLQLLQ